MANYPNPYQGDPAIATIASNLVRAFVDKNPGQTEALRQHARVYGLQGDKLQREMAMRSSVAGAFQRFAKDNGRAPTPAEFAQMTGDAIQGDIKPADLWGHNLGYASNSGQPISAVGRAFVGAGHAIGENQGLSIEDREAVAGRADAARAQRSAIAAGPAYYNANLTDKRAREFHNDEYNFKESTRFDRTENAPQGAAVYPHPDDPKFPKDFKPGTVPAPKPPSADRFVQSTDDQGRTTWQPVSPGLPGPARPPRETAPLDVSSPEITAMESSVLRRIGAAVVDDTNGKVTGVDSEFAKFYADRLQKARLAAAMAYQKSRNSADGELAYLKELGINDGETWQDGQLMSPSGPVSQAGRAIGGAAPTTVRDAFKDAPKPGAPKPGAAAAPQAVDPNAALDEARTAIGRGANRTQVMERLKKLGIDPAGL